MAMLTSTDYLGHLRTESRRFRDVLAACDPTAPVPTCPAWNASDLLWHLTTVQGFWAEIVATRPAAPGERVPTERPDSHEAMLALFDEASAALVTVLGTADPAEPAWTWAREQTVGFTFRRQAHEALIHRLDAEHATGLFSPLDPALAADGVQEALDVMFGGTPAWGEFHPLPRHVRVDCTDTGDAVWVQLGTFTGTDPDTGTSYDEGDIGVVPDPGTPPDAVVAGPAGALDAWLWRRGDDRDVSVTGDREVYDRFRAAVDHPID
ncbi:maleylpyruvate isomerase N-terminal domain-containing protein [Nocardioides sp. KIGAM211]|uniref:Maleylpyruvate isomerase N-terminal domain-containing protein n=1 Tax=Nocardioides luti TaxID=2761101 RepID=A0A7X0VC64_9ACTN|nr:maleylpyruvate isomerase family mycothiol-dependent enzyme [Nocardioides luti]MBB6629426.1 maleylpyruvate isomerase N-terminal domain-containing protein [Nocardioides luti]